MLTFATPTALAALGFLAVPIALHLWSRRTGRPQRIGSIAFFAAAPPPATRHPRIDDFWLLVLRCSVIAALALAVAGPSWRSAGRTGHATWALVDSAAAADPRNASLLDSLRASDVEVRMLGAGPIWSLLRDADYQAPAGTRFVVVAPNHGAAGDRPTLRGEVEWVMPPYAPRTTHHAPAEDVPRSVVVYSDAGRREDSRYVTAALRASAEATGQPAVITQRDVAAVDVTDADWIVWLAAQQVPDALLEQVRAGRTLLTDAQDDEPQTTSSRLRLAAAFVGDQPVLRRRTAVDGRPDEAPVWIDDAGRVVLAIHREGAGSWLRFRARFHPSWGDLVLHPAFPDAVAALWSGDSLRAAARADRAVTVGQLMPARNVAARVPAATARVDLYYAFWLGGLLLFLLERWFAVRTRQVEV